VPPPISIIGVFCRVSQGATPPIPAGEGAR